MIGTLVDAVGIVLLVVAIVGGGTFVTPFIEDAETFAQHAMQLDVQLAGVLAGDQR